MNRGLKNRTPISNAVDTKLYEQLKQLSKDTMIPMSKLLDKAIELVLKEYEKPAK
jgi:predicted DNA-binding protein